MENTEAVMKFRFEEDVKIQDILKIHTRHFETPKLIK